MDTGNRIKGLACLGPTFQPTVSSETGPPVSDEPQIPLGPIQLPSVAASGKPDVRNFEATMRDIYLGYAGAWRGAGLTGPLLAYPTFRARLIENPEMLFRSLLAEAS